MNKEKKILTILCCQTKLICCIQLLLSLLANVCSSQCLAWSFLEIKWDVKNVKSWNNICHPQSILLWRYSEGFFIQILCYYSFNVRISHVVKSIKRHAAIRFSAYADFLLDLRLRFTHQGSYALQVEQRYSALDLCSFQLSTYESCKKSGGTTRQNIVLSFK